jgi:shikimate dehydrogenase
MHGAALRATGLDAHGWTYQHLPVPPDLFAETVRALPGAGFAGANVTIPHKEAALALATEATAAARAIGAANTLTFTASGAIHADNTDAPGTLAALRDAGVDPSAPGTTALVLGAGGSARAVVWALREAGTGVSVWNRTPQRARELASDLRVEAAEASPYTPATILVNCTSVGLHDPSTTFKELPVAADALGDFRCVADLVYRQGGTPLLQAARLAGCAVVDGLEILVRQGAFSFERWTGNAAPLDVMRTSARDPDGRPTDG